MGDNSTVAVTAGPSLVDRVKATADKITNGFEHGDVMGVFQALGELFDEGKELFAFVTNPAADAGPVKFNCTLTAKDDSAAALRRAENAVNLHGPKALQKAQSFAASAPVDKIGDGTILNNLIAALPGILAFIGGLIKVIPHA